jgi:flagellar biosynthesis protein FlhF
VWWIFPMQIRRFEAQDMTEALRLIKQELGPEAVILSVRDVKKESGVFGFLRKQGVEVTAATDTPYPRTKTDSFPKKEPVLRDYQSIQSSSKYLGETASLLSSLGEEIRELKKMIEPLIRRNRIPQTSSLGLLTLHQQMLAQGVEEGIALELIGEVNRIVRSKKIPENGELKSCLIHILEKLVITAGPIKFEQGIQKIVAFVGPTGVGKTTTIAKLAAEEVLQKKRRVALISLDTYRIAAIEQLRIYAKIIGIPIEVASTPKELETHLKKLRDRDLILIDTAGRSQRNGYQVNELKSFFDKISPLEIHLVLSNTTKEEDLIETFERFKKIPIHRLIFTKLDESITYGSILNQLLRTKKPLSYFTNGQKVPDDIEIATPEKVVSLILDNQSSARKIDFHQ